MSDTDCMPAEALPQWRAGLELYRLLASGRISHRPLEALLHPLDEVLSSDPLSVFHFVPLPTGRADRLTTFISIRDDLGINLALAANNSVLVGHCGPPAIKRFGSGSLAACGADTENSTRRGVRGGAPVPSRVLQAT